MSKLLTAVVFILCAGPCFAELSDEVNPIPLRERLRLEMWYQGVPTLKRPIKVEAPKQLPEELERVLPKRDL